MQTQTCAGGGTKKRTCGKGCTWGAWSACSSADGGAGQPDRGGGSGGDGPAPLDLGGALSDLPPMGKPGTSIMEGSCSAGGNGQWLAGLVLLALCLSRRRRACREDRAGTLAER